MRPMTKLISGLAHSPCAPRSLRACGPAASCCWPVEEAPSEEREAGAVDARPAVHDGGCRGHRAWGAGGELDRGRRARRSEDVQPGRGGPPTFPPTEIYHRYVREPRGDRLRDTRIPARAGHVSWQVSEDGLRWTLLVAAGDRLGVMGSRSRPTMSCSPFEAIYDARRPNSPERDRASSIAGEPFTGLQAEDDHTVVIETLAAGRADAARVGDRGIDHSETPVGGRLSTPAALWPPPSGIDTPAAERVREPGGFRLETREPGRTVLARNGTRTTGSSIRPEPGFPTWIASCTSAPVATTPGGSSSRRGRWTPTPFAPTEVVDMLEGQPGRADYRDPRHRAPAWHHSHVVQPERSGENDAGRDAFRRSAAKLALVSRPSLPAGGVARDRPGRDR